jgi:hypothetical protein
MYERQIEKLILVCNTKIKYNYIQGKGIEEHLIHFLEYTSHLLVYPLILRN